MNISFILKKIYLFLFHARQEPNTIQVKSRINIYSFYVTFIMSLVRAYSFMVNKGFKDYQSVFYYSISIVEFTFSF